MRTAFACVLVLAACGSDTGIGGNTDLKPPPDLTVLDLTVPPDLSVPPPDLTQPPPPDLFDPRDFSGITCGSQTCQTGMMCCATQVDGGLSMPMCMTSCSDGGISVSCDGPEDCGAGQTCCANIQTGSGSFPNCPLTANAACTANACNFMLPSGCPGSGRARLCHKPADCAGDPNAANCCRFQQGTGAAITMCVSDLAKFLAAECY